MSYNPELTNALFEFSSAIYKNGYDIKDIDEINILLDGRLIQDMDTLANCWYDNTRFNMSGCFRMKDGTKFERYFNDEKNIFEWFKLD